MVREAEKKELASIFIDLAYLKDTLLVVMLEVRNNIPLVKTEMAEYLILRCLISSIPGLTKEKTSKIVCNVINKVIFEKNENYKGFTIEDLLKEFLVLLEISFVDEGFMVEIGDYYD